MSTASFEIRETEAGNIVLSGRFDASCEAEARRFFKQLLAKVSVEGEGPVHRNTKTVDLRDLIYISSAGLGVLLRAQQELRTCNHELKLLNPSRHVSDVLSYSGFDQIFKIGTSEENSH